MSLPVNNTALVNELRTTLAQIEKQIEAIQKDRWMRMPVHIKPSEDGIYRIQDKNGGYLMTPLLAAKAQCLSAIAALQAPQGRSRGW
jgi:hypothetical protein